MSVVSADLIIYGAANIAESNTGTTGGAIDTTVRYVFDSSTLANTLNDTIDIVSDNAGDTTQTVTVTGRNSEGSIVTEEFALNGLTPIVGSTIFERILKITCSAAHDGTITVVDHDTQTTVVDIETGVLQVRRPFYNVSSDVSGGSSRSFYEKVFVKNTNAVNALLDAVISESADPGANITFDLEDAQNDNNSVASRLNTAPSGMLGSFSSADKNVPGTDLGAGDCCGVWLCMTLAAGAAAAKSTWTMGISGSTT